MKTNHMKILSVLLALILTLSSITVMPLSAAAAEVEVPAKTGDSPYSGLTLDSGKLYFDAASAGWSYGSKNKVAFYIIDDQGSEITTYGNKKAIGTAVADAEGIFEYDVAAKMGVTLTPGVQYQIWFYATSGNSWGGCTYPMYFTTDCLGHVAYCTGANIEYNSFGNSVHGEAACFDGIDPTECGPVLTISDNGDVVGECLTDGKTAYDLFVDFISEIDDNYGRTRLDYTRTNVIELGEKTEQELIDDIAEGLGLSKEDVSRAFSETGVETTWSPDVEPQSEFSYDVTDDTVPSSAVIMSYRGKETTVEVPSEIDGYTVTRLGWGSLGDGVFKDNKTIEKVILPDTIIYIGGYAFKNCTSLAEINIPESVTSIESYAFEGCTSLAEIIIPESIYGIGNSAFEGCTGLTDLYLPMREVWLNGLFGDSNPPENLTIHGYSNSYAEYYAQENNLAFVSIGEIPESDHYSFSINNSVAILNEYSGYQKIVEIPDTYKGYPVTVIEMGAFNYNTRIEEIILPDSITEIRNTLNVDYPTDRTIGAFEGCSSLKNINIPDGVTELKAYTFKGCTSLTEITIPDGVTSIDNSAFDTSRPLTIYGYEGSAAQTYADKYENFTFVPLGTVTDESGVKADVTDGITLDVENITNTVDDSVLPEGTILVAAYDISLVKDGEEVQPENVVTVKIPCDDPDAKVYRLEADGSLTDMKAVYRDGYLVFKTTHFSTYIVATGAEITPAICGDADGDGEVTSFDATIIQRYDAMMDTGIDEAVLMNGDVDGNGELDIIDVTYIQRYLAFMDVPFPIGEQPTEAPTQRPTDADGWGTDIFRP